MLLRGILLHHFSSCPVTTDQASLAFSSDIQALPSTFLALPFSVVSQIIPSWKKLVAFPDSVGNVHFNSYFWNKDSSKDHLWTTLIAH